MKRTVFIVALLVLSIGIPVLAESNDSLSTESENPVLQKQELKLPWYKKTNYTLGYNSDSSLLTSGSPSKDTLKGKGIPFWRKLSYGVGYTSGLGRIVEIQLEPLSPNLWTLFLWNNILNMDLHYYPNTNWEIKLGIGYSWAKGWIRMLESSNFISLGSANYIIPISFSILYEKVHNTKIGLNARFIKGTRRSLGREIGIMISFTPIERELRAKFKYDISLSVRYILGKGPYIATERKELFDYDILELSLKIDLSHPFEITTTKNIRRDR